MPHFLHVIEIIFILTDVITEIILSSCFHSSNLQRNTERDGNTNKYLALLLTLLFCSKYNSTKSEECPIQDNKIIERIIELRTIDYLNIKKIIFFVYVDYRDDTTMNLAGQQNILHNPTNNVVTP